ncbi:hypothetical protein MMC16_001264 [Acarospora aff. strigata]|nr:hypothetical protein [Acarospora aff. strigata]
MPSIVEDISLTSQHIPAWKKLGLKLKFAKDLSTQPIEGANNEAKPSKRKLVDDEVTVHNPKPTKSHNRKRTKTESSSDRPLAVNENAESSVREISAEGADTSSTPLPARSKKRKSVAFTPETKVEDGDSTKQLFYAWVAEQVAKDSNFKPEALGVAFKTVEPRSDTKFDTQEKLKRPKKKEKQPRTVPSDTPTEQEVYVHPAITYLQQYHESRKTWKFNKAKQTYILKHLFDIDKLPPSIDPALTSYIEGLQGADARSRVKKAAEAIREEDDKAKKTIEEENMEDPVRRQQYYDTALKHLQAHIKGQIKEEQDVEKELDPEWQQKFAKRKRAERILWTMGDSESGLKANAALQERGVLPSRDRGQVNGDGGVKRIKTNDGTARRRRKRRTGVPDDDETSSSSSGTTESASGEDTSSESETSSDSEEAAESSGSSSSSSSSSSSPASSSSDPGASNTEDDSSESENNDTGA